MADPNAKNPWLPQWASASPMLAPLLGVGKAFAGRPAWPTLDDYNALLDPPLHTAANARLRFVPQGARASRMEDSYEGRIHLRGEVQTRTENWHDFFNALVWLAFPRTKAALNARHFDAMSRDPDNKRRGEARDALTLFDESGVAVVCADETLARVLENRCWKELFWTRREDLRARMRFVVFGHSLHEKALHPYIGLTGKGLLLDVDREFVSLPAQQFGPALDAALANRFGRETPLTPAQLLPVPLLGVPGWHEANATAVFYDDTTYFRPMTRQPKDTLEKPLAPSARQADEGGEAET